MEDDRFFFLLARKSHRFPIAFSFDFGETLMVTPSFTIDL